MACMPILILVLLVASQDPGRSDASRAAELSALAEYNARRDKSPDTADAHWKIGLWCEQKGLTAEAKSEFAAVVRLEPAREAAWRKLGFIKREGRWVTPEQIAFERAEAEAQRKADAKWTPLLQKWRASLAQKNRRADAEASLNSVTDTRAVPSILRVFGSGGPDDQERAIDLLGRIDDERSSRALAGLAIFGRSDLVRKAAIETLIRRKADGVLISWISLLRDPIKYEVRQVAGPGSPGVLMVEGEQYIARRFYAPPSLAQTESMFLGSTMSPMESFVVPLQYNSTPPGPPPGSKYVGERPDHTKLFVYDYTWAPPPPKVASRTSPDPSAAYQQFEMSVLQGQSNSEFALTETAKMAAGAQMRLQGDVQTIEQANGSIREANARLVSALRRVSGKDLGDDRESWLKWWMDRRGYTYVAPKDRPKSTVDVQVALPYVPTHGPTIFTSSGNGGGSPGYCMVYDHEKGQKPRMDVCFAAGTAVQTPAGPRVIESLREGDLVYTRGQPGAPEQAVSLVSTYQSTAERTLRLVIDGEVIVTTAGHPLWKLGSGWRRAGDLNPGDEVLTRSGKARVESAIEVTGPTTVYNLRLASGSGYFVGRLELLAHDVRPFSGVTPSEGKEILTSP